MGGVGALVCPTCGEALRDGAAWRRLRDVPGALPAYCISHRRAGGGRCQTVRGAWRDGADACTDAGAACTIGANSRSARDDDLATAS